MTAGGGDALLEHAHLVGEGRLVTHGGRHAAEQRGHLRTRLGEAEDVVDEQQHVLLLHVAEVLRHGQSGQRHPQTGARGLVHLAEDERGVLEDVRLLHLQPQVVALTGALADAREHRGARELQRDAADHLLDQNGLADARAAEQTDLAALHVRREQVDDLDAGGQHLRTGLELVERWGRTVDRPALVDLDGGLVRVERLAEGVPHVALDGVADRHRDRRAGVGDGRTADHAVGGLHRDGPDDVVAEVLRDLQRQGLGLATELDVDGERVVDVRHGLDGELHVDDRTGDAGDTAHGGLNSLCGHFTLSPLRRQPARSRHRRSR